MPALHGLQLYLDAASADALAPWLDADSAPSTNPAIAVEVLADPSEPAPIVQEVLLEEAVGWLGRTAHGLAVGNREDAWFTIEQSPPRIRGVLGRRAGSPATRELLLGALVVALRAMGVHGVHAGAVAYRDQALVLVGDSGAGKSTTATALISVGCHYLSDDGLLIRERAADVELLPLFSSFRLTEQSLRCFDALRPYASKSIVEDKWKLDVCSAFPGQQLPHWLGPKTLLFLERAVGQRSSLRPVSPAEAVGLLIAQSNALSLTCHPDPRSHLDLLARLVSVARIAKLELGGEWLSDPSAAARALLEQVHSLPSARERPSGAS